jgi:tetratricopeptide (TPR) repeat protein
MAMGFNTVASALYGRRQYEQALAGWRKAFELASMGDDDLMRASLLNNIAQAQRSIGRPEEAVAPQVSALGLYRKVGEFSFSVIAMANLAELYEQIGYLDDAERHATEAIELASGAGMVLQEAFARQVLGRVHRDRGRFGSARTLLARALELYTEIGSPFAQSARSEIDALPADVSRAVSGSSMVGGSLCPGAPRGSARGAAPLLGVCCPDVTAGRRRQGSGRRPAVAVVLLSPPPTPGHPALALLVVVHDRVVLEVVLLVRTARPCAR